MTEELSRCIKAVEAALAVVSVEREGASKALSLALSDARAGLQDTLADLRYELKEAEEYEELNKPNEWMLRQMRMSNYR